MQPELKPRRRFTSAQLEDNARWERIWNERFADPYYYKPKARFGSSLGQPVRSGRSDRRSSVTESAE
jgi:hypothetical protein